MSVRPLPRLANLIALRSMSAESLRRFTERASKHAGFRLFSPAPGWLVAVRDLPGSEAPDARDECAGLFVAEGQRHLPAVDDARAARRTWLHDSPDRSSTSSEDVDDLCFLSVAHDGSAVLQRSLGGRVPCYSWSRGDDLLLTTDSSLLLRIGEHDGRPDPLITAMCLSALYGNDVDGRAHLLGVRRLNVAQGLAIDLVGNTRRYEHWCPPCFDELRWPSKAAQGERLARFRTTLLNTLDQGLAHQGQNLLAFSGGVDSSLLLALAVGQLQRPVASFSLVPAVDDPAYAREIERIAWMRSLYPTQPHLALEAFSEAQIALRQQLLPAAHPMFNPHISGLALLRGKARPHVSFGGELADPVCGSHAFTLGDFCVHAPRHAVALRPSQLPRGLRRIDLLRPEATLEHLMRWQLPVGGNLDPWVHRDLHHEWSEARARVVSRLRASVCEVANPFLWARVRESEWRAMQWEWCSAQDVHRLSPFASSRLVALALCSHPSERLGNRDKLLARGAFARAGFPPELLGRRDKGIHEKPRSPDPEAPAQWRAALQELDSDWRALVDPHWPPMAKIAGKSVNDHEDLGNLCKLRDVPLRLAFFARNVYKLRKVHP